MKAGSGKELSRDDAELFANWFRCLSDATRLQILHLLANEGPLRVTEMVARLGVGQSTVSEHLRRLAETRFVLVEHRGTSSYFELNRRCLSALPSATDLLLGGARPDSLPAAAPGATSRKARRSATMRDGTAQDPGAQPAVRGRRGTARR
jgi:DNA-binding transcriptional ArsR family regulator